MQSPSKITNLKDIITPEEMADLYQFLQETFHDVENDQNLSWDCTKEDVSLMRQPIPNSEPETETETETETEAEKLVLHIPTIWKPSIKRQTQESVQMITPKKQNTIQPPKHTPKNKNYEGFHEYIRRYYPWSSINGWNQAIPLQEEESEDLCFITKDGGDLVLCDYPGCKKAYAKDAIPASCPFSKDKSWTCPRHYCTGCIESPTRQVKYVCMLCPFSSCVDCAPLFENTYGWTVLPPSALHPNDIALNDTLPDITWITCNNCTAELEKRKERRVSDIRRYKKRYEYLEQIDLSRKIYCEMVVGAKPPPRKKPRRN